MRRALPLCAIFFATCLLVGGAWSSMAASTPSVPAQTDSSTTQLAPDNVGAPDSKWIETQFGGPKRSK